MNIYKDDLMLNQLNKVQIRPKNFCLVSGKTMQTKNINELGLQITDIQRFLLVRSDKFPSESCSTLSNLKSVFIYLITLIPLTWLCSHTLTVTLSYRWTQSGIFLGCQVPHLYSYCTVIGQVFLYSQKQSAVH